MLLPLTSPEPQTHLEIRIYEVCALYKACTALHGSRVRHNRHNMKKKATA